MAAVIFPDPLDQSGPAYVFGTRMVVLTSQNIFLLFLQPFKNCEKPEFNVKIKSRLLTAIFSIFNILLLFRDSQTHN